ncbi:MAG: (d)CMP kinase [Bacteriovoracaceae bacterium]
MNANLALVIAIDGPSGSGKSTLAKMLAEHLQVTYIDTGAMFRAVATAAHDNGLEINDSTEFQNFVQELNIEYWGKPERLISINGIDLTHKIREHHVSALASKVSQIPCVREKLLKFQRSFASSNVCVMEGRDIGTIVFPNAFIKFFVTASVEIRARRRHEQLEANGETGLTLEQIKEDVQRRDETDRKRDVAPLKEAEDAIHFDSTEHSLEDSIKAMVEQVKERAGSLGIELK